MRPLYLLMAGVLVLLGSGASALGWFASGENSALEGVIAEDSITITVTDPTVLERLPVTGAEIGMLVGIGLILAALGWALLEYRRRQQERAARIERGRRFRTPSP